MTITAILTLTLVLTIGLVGLVFLLFPDHISDLEARLNAPWGDREVTALRVGLRGEQAIEQTMNRSVLTTQITWDGWSRRHPRLVGAVLCGVAVLLWWQI